MFTLKSRTAATALAAGLTLTLAACGSDDAAAPETPDTTTEETSSEPLAAVDSLTGVQTAVTLDTRTATLRDLRIVYLIAALLIALILGAVLRSLVAPILVLLSFVIGPNPMPLVFNGFELGGVLLAVLIAAYVTQDGESNWFEGIQLLAVYVVLGLAFLYA